MSGAIIHTANLSIGYTHRKEEYVVQNKLNLNVFRGELVCLIGPNGCGKSTLLRSLAGLQPVLQGEIIIEGRPIGKQTLKDKGAPHRIGTYRPGGSKQYNCLSTYCTRS